MQSPGRNTRFPKIIFESFENRVQRHSPGKLHLNQLNTHKKSLSSVIQKSKLSRLTEPLSSKFFNADPECSHCKSSTPQSQSLHISKSKSKPIPKLSHILSSELLRINQVLSQNELNLSQVPSPDPLSHYQLECSIYKDHILSLCTLSSSFSAEISSNFETCIKKLSKLFNRLIITCAQRKTELIIVPKKELQDKHYSFSISTQTENFSIETPENELETIRRLNDKLKNINLPRVTNRLLELKEMMVGMYTPWSEQFDRVELEPGSYAALLRYVASQFRKGEDRGLGGLDRDERLERLERLEMSREDLAGAEGEKIIWDEQRSEKTEKIERSEERLAIEKKRLSCDLKESIERNENFLIVPESGFEKALEMENEINRLKGICARDLKEINKLKQELKKFNLKKEDKAVATCLDVVEKEVYLKVLGDYEGVLKSVQEQQGMLLEIESSWFKLNKTKYVYGNFFASLRNKEKTEGPTNAKFETSPEKILKNNRIQSKIKNTDKDFPVSPKPKLCFVHLQSFKIDPVISKRKAKESTQDCIESHEVKAEESDTLGPVSNNREAFSLTKDKKPKLKDTNGRSRNLNVKMIERKLYQALNEYQWDIFEDYKLNRKKMMKKNRMLKEIQKLSIITVQDISIDPNKPCFDSPLAVKKSDLTDFKTLSTSDLSSFGQNPKYKPFLIQILDNDDFGSYPPAFQFKLLKLAQEHFAKSCSPPCEHLKRALLFKSRCHLISYPINKINM